MNEATLNAENGSAAPAGDVAPLAGEWVTPQVTKLDLETAQLTPP
jgi:hypothetical protein